MAVAGLGQARLFVDAFAGIEGARIEAGELHPFPMGKAWRQQQEFAHERDGAGFGNALDAHEQRTHVQGRVFSDQDQRLLVADRYVFQLGDGQVDISSTLCFL